MTQASVLGSAGVGYLADVAAALADIPAVERDELLEEVHEHLTSIVVEAGRDMERTELISRLGPPQRYAAELRAAAGLAQPPREPRPSLWTIAQTRAGVSQTWAYVRRLEPAWWALRGYLVAGLILPLWFGVPGIANGGSAFVNAYWLHWHVDDPGYYNGRTRFFWLIPVAIIVVLSIVVGLRAENQPTVGRRVMTRALDAAGVVAVILLPMWWLGPLLYDFALHR